MPGALINIRIPQELHRDVKAFSKAAGYGSVQEFAREAIREHLRRRRIEWGTQEMRRLYGSAKGKKVAPMSPAERDKLAMEAPSRSLMDLFGTVDLDPEEFQALRKREREVGHDRDERFLRKRKAATPK